ncbi:hypothetical protein CKA32_001352 [Geitlerinema sp. FC II]|nr:hypothetical protein CKA32_001352 [Geitlerinema sp. FC II]
MNSKLAPDRPPTDLADDRLLNPRLRRWSVSFAVTTAIAIALPQPARSVSFHFDYAPDTTLDQMLGFETAAALWSDYLDDDVTVNLYIDIVDTLPNQVIGGALPGIRANQRYETWREQLELDATTADDALAIANQQDDDNQFTALVNGHKVDNNEYMKMTRANAKALGMLDGNASDLDGYILMSDLSNTKQYDWNYDYFSDIVPKKTIDFASVAIHEIGHVLGFVSGVDKPGWLTQLWRYRWYGNYNSNYYDTLIGNLNHATPLDMFRYSNKSLEMSGSDDVWIDMSVGRNPFFSVEGNQALWTKHKDRTYFSTGKNGWLGGDGAQASHWKSYPNKPIGIMDPYLKAGQRREISEVDLLAFDAIGWDRTTGGTDLATLYARAEQNLADRLGIEVGDLSDDIARTLTTFEDADDNGIDDRVEKMVVDSEIYEWGGGGSGGGSGGGGSWQEFLEQELSAQTIGTASTSTSVPEPSFLWGLGLLGIHVGLKRSIRGGKRPNRRVQQVQ